MSLAEQSCRSLRSAQSCRLMSSASDPGAVDPTIIALRYATKTYLGYCKWRLVAEGSPDTSESQAVPLGVDEANEALQAICGIWNWVRRCCVYG